MRIFKHFLSWCLFLVPGICLGQQMSIDRPDQTDGASTVPKCTIQIETEFYAVWYTEHHTSVICSNLVRYGINDRLELRFAFDQGLNRHAFIAETAQGFYPVTLGAKLNLIKHQRGWPDIGLIAGVQLPVTNRKEEHQYWAPAIIVAVEQKVRKFNLGVNAGVKQEAFEKEHVWQLSGDVKYELDPRIEIFLEYFTQIKDKANPNQNTDAGILVHVNKRWMIYGSLGERLDAPNRNYFLNSGFAVQL